MDTKNIHQINFKQPKYVIPAIIYVGVLFLGFMVMQIMNTDTSGKKDFGTTTDYLNSDLPSANTDSVLGDKMDNSEKEYGSITDLSGVNTIENDNDSVAKKEDYESRYNDQEAARVQQQNEQYQRQEARKLREMQDRVRTPRSSGSTSFDDDFTDTAADNAIARAQRRRRQREIERIGRALDSDPYSSTYDTGSSLSGNGGNGYGNSGMPDYQGEGGVNGSYGNSVNGGNGYGESSYGNGSNSANGRSSQVYADGGEVQKVVKKERSSSDYFNTVGRSTKKSKLITAIIDENIKAVEGSRVRLRLLDDVEIGDLTVKTGTYLYATLSGFGQQRVKGTIGSIFYDEEIIKVSLSIYDTDGLEGLYVPESEFRTTAKDVGSSAMTGGQIIDQTGTSTGIKGWASQAAQNATQKIMNTFSKVIKKNRVKLKYGTKVYLVDGSQNKDSRRQSDKD